MSRGDHQPRAAPSAERCNASGWPRPYAPYTNPLQGGEQMLPVPWRAGENALRSQNFVDERVLPDGGSPDRTTSYEGLCEVCGDALGEVVLLGRIYFDGDVRFMTQEERAAQETHPLRGYVDGYGTHPRCMALALRFCPHFNEAAIDAEEPVAYVHALADHRRWAMVAYEQRSIRSEDIKPLAGSQAVTQGEVIALARQDRPAPVMRATDS